MDQENQGSKTPVTDRADLTEGEKLDLLLIKAEKALETYTDDREKNKLSLPPHENPWTEQGFNITAQHQYLRQDPKLALRLQLEAGVKVAKLQGDAFNPWRESTWDPSLQRRISIADGRQAARMQIEAHKEKQMKKSTERLEHIPLEKMSITQKMVYMKKHPEKFEEEFKVDDRPTFVQAIEKTRKYRR